MKGILCAAAGALAAAAIAVACSEAQAPRGSAVPGEHGRAGEHPGSAGEAVSDGQNVILVTVDGVRWQEIFGGVDPRLAQQARLPRSAILGARELLPAFHRLFFEGGTVLGDPRMPGGIAASGPHFVSLPGYLEILTGQVTGCRNNDCAPSLARTLADDVARLPALRRDHVAVFASWERLARFAAAPRGAPEAAPHGVVVDAGRGKGDPSPAFPGIEGYRPDRGTAAAAIAHLVAHRPRFLWVSLGDTDEWAHRSDYRGYLEALRFADRFVEEVALHLEEMGDYGERTAILVTTDHGRDESFHAHGGPASGQVWLLARGGGVPRRGAVGTQQRRYLRDLAPTVQALLDMPVRGCGGCGEVIAELAPDQPPAETAAR